MNLDFQKTLDQTGGSDNADTWQLTVSGLTSGAWVGPNTNTSVSVEFDSAGNVVQVNGQSATSFTVNVSDGTSSGQDVAVDLSQMLSGAAVAPSASANGIPLTSTFGLSQVYNGNATPPPATSVATFVGHLDSSAPIATVSSTTMNWYDRTGTLHLVQVDLTKTVDAAGDGDTWDFTAVGPFSGGPWTGASGALSGTLTFDANGDPSGPTTFVMDVADGTTGGQSVLLDFTPVQNDPPLSFTGSADGSVGPADPTQNTSYSGDLDDAASVGTIVTQNLTMYDFSGTAHVVTLTLTKSVDISGENDAWDYALTGFTGGNWNGVIGGTGTENGTLTFNNFGNLTGPATPFTLIVDDTVDGPQTITFDISGITNKGNTPSYGGLSNVTASNPPDPTNAASFSGVLDMDALVGTSFTMNQTWYDRRTGNVAHPVNITFTKVGIHDWTYAGLADQWAYDMTGAYPGGNWMGGIFGTDPGSFGSITFDAAGNVTSIFDGVTSTNYAGNTITLNVADGTAGGQNILMDFSGFNSVSITPTTSVTGTQDGSNANPADPSTTFTLTGAIDSHRLTPTGNDTFTKPITLTDATGVNHSVNMVFTKQDTDLWQYEIQIPATANGDWTGGGSANLTGTLLFDNDTHAMSLINGAAPAAFNVTINDRNGNQTVSVDLTALTQPTNGTTGNSTVPVSIVADEYTATFDSTWASRVVSGAGPTEFKIFPVFDKTGMDTIDGVKVTFTQVGDTNSWNWAVTAPAVSGLTGIVHGGTGTVNFNHAGNLLGPTQFKATLDDGTPEGQTINFNITTCAWVARLTCWAPPPMVAKAANSPSTRSSPTPAKTAETRW